MKTLRPLVPALLALFAVAPAARSADDDAAPTGPIMAVAPFVGGEWRIEGNWAGGEALTARETFEWGLNKKFVESRTWVTRNDGTGEYERYRGIFAVKDDKLVSYNFSFDGSSTMDEVQVQGKVIKVTRQVPDRQMVIRQEIELTGPDKFKWRVWLERQGKSEQIMDGEWTRQREGEKK